MKTIFGITLITGLLLSGLVSAQSTYFERHYLKFSPIEASRKISCEIESGDVEINGAYGDSIKLDLEVYNAPDKNYQCLQDECMVIDENFFHFKIKPREGEKIKKLSITLPNTTAIQLKNYGKGNIVINGMNKEIQINTMRVNDITLKKVKGPLSINGTYGSIYVEFLKGFSKKTMAISLMKGNINISIPKGEKATFATSCPEVKSTNKNYPIKTSSSFKYKNELKKDTSTYNQSQLSRRNLTINSNYTEKIDQRDYFGLGSYKSKRKKDKDLLYYKEDVWVYDLNGGAGNIEVKIYDGNIKINEVDN